jgi:hypothetical protein
VAVTFIASAQAANVGATDVSITVPAGVTTSHFGVLCVATVQAAMPAMTVPTGWTARDNPGTGGSSGTLYIFTRLGGVSAGQTITVTLPSSQGATTTAAWYDTQGRDVAQASTKWDSASADVSTVTWNAPGQAAATDVILAAATRNPVANSWSTPTGTTKDFYGVDSSWTCGAYFGHVNGVTSASYSSTLTGGTTHNVNTMAFALTPPSSGGSAPVLAATGTFCAYVAGRTSTPIPVPSGVTAGDIILAHVYADDSTPTITPPTGFTEITFGTAPTTTTPSMTVHTYWKRATGADSGTYTFTHGTANTQGIAQRFTGCVTTGTPVEALGGANRNTSAATAPSITGTTTHDNELLVYTSAVYTNTTWTAMSGWTTSYNGGNGQYEAVKTQATAGSTGAIAATSTVANAEVASLVGLIPASSGGGGVVGPAPVLASSSSKASGTVTTTSLPVPTGVAAGDVVLVHMYLEATSAVTPPAGFTEVTFATSPTTTGTVSIQRVFWKRATGADTGTYDFTHASAWTNATASRWTGCAAPGTPFEVATGAQRSTTGTTAPTVSATTTGANEVLVYGLTNRTTADYTPPTGFTEIYDGGELETAYQTQASAGATGSVSGTSTVAAVQTSTLLALLAPSGVTVQGATIAETASGTSVTINVPAGTTDGDLLMLSVASGAASMPSSFTGWTHVLSNINGGATCQIGQFYRIASSEPASYTLSGFTTGRITAELVRITGADTTTPLDVTPTSAAATGSITAGTLTTATDKALVFYTVGQDAATSSDFTVPSGVTLIENSTGTGKRLISAYEVQSAAGTTTSRTFTETAGPLNAGAFTTAIRPASSSSSGGSAADPSTISSLVNRWVASDIGAANGAAVSSWTPRTGTGAWAQATSTAQPSYIVSGINGKPIVRFDGASDQMTATLTARAQPHTVVLVAKNATASPASTQQPIDLSNPQLVSVGSAWGDWEGTATISGGTWNTTATVITAVGNGASSAIYQNGTSVATGNPGTGSSGTSAVLGNWSSGSRFYGGDIAEILIFNAALSAADRATVHSYVQDTYGITVSDYVASGTNYTPAPADTVGLTDAVQSVLVPSQADTVGLSDALTIVQNENASLTVNSVGVTDLASTAASLPKTAADSVGLTDAVTKVLTTVRAPADTLGVTDVGLGSVFPPLASLVDPFNTADTTKWIFGADASVANGRVTCTTTTGYTGVLNSVGRYNLIGTQATMRVVQVAPDAADGSTDQAFLTLTLDPANSNDHALTFDLYGGFLHFFSVVAGNFTDVGTAVPYDPVAHRWWRFSQPGLQVLWQTSPDGVTWTTRAAWTPTFDTSGVYVSLGTGNWNNLPGTLGAAVFDSFNVPAAAAITDDFATLDPAKWSIDFPAKASSVAGTGQLALVADSGYVNLFGTADVDLTDSAVSGQLLPMPTVASGAVEFYLGIVDRKSFNNQLWIDVKSGVLAAYGWEGNTNAVGYGFTTLPTGVPSVLLRLRHSSATNTIYFEYSTDGFTWTTFGSRVGLPFDISQVFIDIGAGTDNASTTPTVLFDNLNLPVFWYQKTAADTVGASDASSKGYGSAPADTLGLTDTPSRVTGQSVTRADTLGIIDAEGWVHGDSAQDAVGLTDSLSLTYVFGAIPPVNPVGLTDAVTVSQGTLRTAADTIGVTDAEAIYGQLSEVTSTTARPDIETPAVGLTDVASLSGTAGLALDLTPAPDLEVGPQRAVIEVDAGTTELTHVVALSGSASASVSTRSTNLHVVHRMTDILTKNIINAIQKMTLRNGPIYTVPQTSWPTGTTFPAFSGGFSVDGSKHLIMQNDRNLVIYDDATGTVPWASDSWTSTLSSAYSARFDTTGTLRVIDADGTTVVWSSGSGGAGAALYLGDDGTLFIVRSDGSVAWTSNSSGSTALTAYAGTGGLTGALGPTDRPVWRLTRNLAVPQGWGTFIAADPFDDIPQGTTLQLSVWVRMSGPGTATFDVVGDAATGRVGPSSWSWTTPDGNWHQWTQTFTTVADWVTGFQRLRTVVDTDWIEWSDPVLQVTTPLQTNLVPEPEPEPAPRRINRVFAVLR